MFKQLFDTESSTYTYLVTDENNNEAAIIDPVIAHFDRYIKLLAQHQLNLKYALETHVHADHVTASGMLREHFGIQTGVSEQCGATNADLQLNEGDTLLLGNQVIKVMATPGHTAGSLCFLMNDRLFTGDTLLIDGCGRTDFQGGSAASMYESIVQKIFTLPDETLIYPGHDYNGRRVSSVIQEKTINRRLADQTKESFITIMDNLNLPKPKLIDIAVPANRQCGLPEIDVTQG